MTPHQNRLDETVLMMGHNIYFKGIIRKIIPIYPLLSGALETEQTAQTQLRLLKEQSDQDLHCLPFHRHLLDELLHCKTKPYHFKDNYCNYLRCPRF